MNNYKTLALALCLMASGGVMAQNSAGASHRRCSHK